MKLESLKEDRSVTSSMEVVEVDVERSFCQSNESYGVDPTPWCAPSSSPWDNIWNQNLSHMKKSIYFIFIALLCAVGCQVQELEGPEEVIVGEEFFYAEIEQNGSTTKTYIDEFNHVNFQKGDQVVAFIGNIELKKFQVEDSAEGKTSGKFNVVKDSDGKRVGSVDALNAFLAYYPYQKINVDQSHVSEGRYSLRGISFPSEQKYDAKHIVSQNALPMMSISADVSEGTVFKNVCGVIRLNIRGNGNIRQISFRGLNGENFRHCDGIDEYE